MSSAPVDDAATQTAEDADDEEMPRVVITRERALLFGVFVLSAIAFLYFVLPKLAGWHVGVDPQPGRRQARGGWRSLRPGVPVLRADTWSSSGPSSCAANSRIDWSASYEITMAGVAATRLFAAAGAGGVALTAWALRRSGMERRMVACRMVAFLALLYAVYMGAIVVFGLGLYFGLFNGPAPFAITVVPAIFALILISLFLAHVAAARRCRAAHRAVGRRLGAGGAHHGQGRHDPGVGRRRGADRDRPRARSRMGRARGRCLVGVRHRHAVGVLPRLSDRIRRPSR